VLQLRQWLSLLGSELDYDYETVEQPRGNSFIRHSRAKVLGGCSSHNTLISFRPLPKDLDEWVALGCDGWDYKSFETYADRIKCQIQPVADKDRNQLTKDWVVAASVATGAPIIYDFHSWSKNRADPSPNGVGFLSIAYTPHDGKRSSASVAYIHPILGKRDNLTLLLETWCSKLVLDGDKRATAVVVETKTGEKLTLHARHEIVLSAGAIDTPRLLLHSGIGPAKQLRDLGIDVRHELPGVGENLLDHPERCLLLLLLWPGLIFPLKMGSLIIIINVHQYHHVGD
jgi:choline dehydrogenase-like flavoprotein